MNECECELKKLWSGRMQEEEYKEVYEKKVDFSFWLVVDQFFHCCL
jgi:hypothetical protein